MLVRCGNCTLHYVVRPASQAPPPGPASQKAGRESADAAAEMRRLAARARELELIEPDVESQETHWRVLTAAERFADLRRFIRQGRLLEIGCSTGDFLLAAREAFSVAGLEADEETGRSARERGLDCLSGTLEEARFADQEFDAVALYHVIEHLPSPRRTLQEIHRLLAPGGWLALETPNIASFWVRLLGRHWRQFIPDHIFFFTPQTITRLCRETGFEIREIRPIGKSMSVRLFLSRLGRYHKPLARGLMRLSDRMNFSSRTLYLNPGDVMRVYARKQLQ